MMAAMNYGFLIRNDRCIGCHACSTACKSENDVPVGVNRTWVKNVEKGRYPDVRRTFQVTRCNHCANPPCATICPVTAMYQRADGIVEFDAERCIGCKACLQACPYDAIYVDPDSGTAAKCHFCAHRTDLGLEPACVVVCPEHAIVAGDLDDPASEISGMLADFDVTVRKPEQGTVPKLFYVDGDEAALSPAAASAMSTFAWAEPDPSASVTGRDGSQPPRSKGRDGPITFGEGRRADDLIRTVYDVRHRMPWHWPVPAYLVTKAVAAGIFLLLAAGTLLGFVPFEPVGYLASGGLALAAIGATTALLVLDLERPERFLRVLTRPQWRSWLTRGAYILVLFSVVAGGWWLLELGGAVGWWDDAGALAVREGLLLAAIPLAVGAAVYTGFLFAQAEGRDLWQSPLLPVHLLLQALLAGAAALAVLALFVELGAALVALARATLLTTLVLDLFVVHVGELGIPHASDTAARAARSIRAGRYRTHYWLGALVLGHILPIGLLLFPALAGSWTSGPSIALAGAGLATLAGLYLYEHAFVMAPQRIPNS